MAGCASACEFELDDEEAAFAYAEERVRATAEPARGHEQGQPSVERRRTSDAGPRCRRRCRVLVVHEFVYDDRRRLGGDPLRDLAAGGRPSSESSSSTPEFGGRTLAVAVSALQLAWSRWSDDAGYETTYLHVHEIGDDGR